jgi:hypothetical protein
MVDCVRAICAYGRGRCILWWRLRVLIGLICLIGLRFADEQASPGLVGACLAALLVAVFL